MPKNTPGNAKPAAEQPMDRHSSDGRDDSRFSQDVQGCETRSRFTHDDAGGPHDRRYHSSRRPMGSDDTIAVVPSRGATPPDQAGVAETSTCTHPLSARQKGANQHARCENCLKCHQRLVTEKRDHWKEARFLPEKALKEETARRMEEQKNKAIRAPPAHRHVRPRSNR